MVKLFTAYSALLEVPLVGPMDAQRTHEIKQSVERENAKTDNRDEAKARNYRCQNATADKFSCTIKEYVAHRRGPALVWWSQMP
jgi:hypothetical protein